MKSSVEKLTDTRVKLTVEVPFGELDRELDNAYKAIAKQVSIPGFRRGKAPRQLIDARIGRGAVLEQVVNDMLPSRYSAAVEENELAVIGQPDIDITKLEDGKFIEFTAEVDVRPEITLPDFSSYDVEVDAVKLDDDDAVDSEIDDLRRRFATRADVDRAAAKDDLATVNLEAEIDGTKLDEVSAEGVTHVVGSDELLPGIDEAIEGLKVDESTSFTTTLEFGEHKGKEAQITVTLTKLQEQKLPELDDDFAQEVSEFDTVDELREAVTKRLDERAKADQAAQIRDEVLNKALDEAKFELPVSVVDEQVAAQKQQLLNQIGGDEKVLDTLLAGEGMSREKFEADTREQAEKAVRTQLFLDALADEIKPQVSQEEFSDHIVFTAQSYGIEPAQFVAQLQNSGQIGNLFADVRRGKALAAAICKVSVKDSNGEVIDAAEFFGEEDVDTEQADDSAEN